MGEMIYSRIKELNPDEFLRMKEILTLFYEKIKKSFDSNLYVDVHVYDSKGNENKRKKYVINLRLDLQGKKVVAEDFDWDIAKAVHKVISNIDSELKHITKKDSNRVRMRHMIHRSAKG